MIAKQNPKAADSGSLHFDGRTISYNSQHYGAFSLLLTEVAAIGEFTTDNGPFIDDWFLVFVACKGQTFYEASMYAEHCDDVRAQLGEALGSELATGLAASTDFHSRVLWPPPLVGKPLYTFSDELSEATGFWHRLRLRVFPRLVHRLSPEIVQHLSGVT